jgi:hypothetical protein
MIIIITLRVLSGEKKVPKKHHHNHVTFWVFFVQLRIAENNFQTTCPSAETIR